MKKNLTTFTVIYLLSFLLSINYYFSDTYIACKNKMASGIQTLCFVDSMMWWFVECAIFIPWLLITVFFVLKPRLTISHPKIVTSIIVLLIGCLLYFTINYLPLPSVIAGLIFG